MKPDRFGPCDKGFERQQDTFVCDNGGDTNVVRGVTQHLMLNQAKPEPFFVRAYSKAEGVTGSANYDYALYLDIRYAPGKIGSTQTAAFSVGTHEWELREIYFVPDKPVHDVSCHLLFRKHGGKVWFRPHEFYLVKAPEGGVRVATNGPRPVELVDAAPSQAAKANSAPPVAKLVKTSENLLMPFSFTPMPMDQGCKQDGETFVCDNGGNAKVSRGVEQRVELGRPSPGRSSPWPTARGKGSGAGQPGVFGLSRRAAHRRHVHTLAVFRL